jgi:hypothetical protein
VSSEPTTSRPVTGESAGYPARLPLGVAFQLCVKVEEAKFYV